MPRESPAFVQGGARRVEVLRRYSVDKWRGRGIPGPQIYGLTGKNKRRARPRPQGWVDNAPHTFYARNRVHDVDHAFFHRGDSIAGVARHIQFGLHQHYVSGVETEIAVQRADQST